MLLLLAACTTPDEAAMVDARTPEERLDALAPGLAAAVAQRTEELGQVADLLERTDRLLVRQLVPPAQGLAWSDPAGDGTVGPDGPADLLSAQVRLDRTVLSGEITAVGADAYGAALWLDTRDGPAPDVRLRLGREGARIARLHDLVPGIEEAVPAELTVEGQLLRFSVDLGPAGVLEAGHAGAATAMVGPEGAVDSGPAGLVGVAPAAAVESLVALLLPSDPDSPVAAERGSPTAGTVAARAGEDPDLTVSVALAYGAFLPLVQPEVRPLVRADARARLLYGLALDPWLEREGAGWRLGRLPAVAKLLWAWPAGENVVYGALPLAWEEQPLTREGYRYHAPGLDDLVALRDAWPVPADIDDAALTRDDGVWQEMTYRAKDEGMAALCDARRLDAGTCFAWETDRKAGQALGPVDGRPIALHEATSIALQTARWADDGDFIGDCTTATTMAAAAWQAVGIAPLAVGYAGPDWYWPTHNQPLYFDGDRFRATQGMPDPKWDADEAWAYAVLPPVGGPVALTLGWERLGWARGGSVAGCSGTYGTIGRAFTRGGSAAWAAAMVDAPTARQWPELSLP